MSRRYAWRLTVVFTMALLCGFFGVGVAVAQTDAEKLVVGFGDSMGQGAADWDPSRGYVGYNGRYADRIGATLENYSQGGADSAYIEWKMGEEADRIAAADVVTTDGGGNDMRVARNAYKKGTCGAGCLAGVVANFKSNYTQMLQTIEDNRKDEAQVIVMSYFYPWVSEDWGNGYPVLSYYFKQMDDHAKAEAGRFGYEYVDLIRIFNGSWSQPHPPQWYGLTTYSDVLHPTTKGHDETEEEMNALVEAS